MTIASLSRTWFCLFCNHSLGCGRLQLAFTLSLVFSRMKPPVPSAFPHGLQAPNRATGPPLACLRVMSLVLGWQNWRKGTTYLLTSTKQSGIIIYPNPLTVLLLMQHSVLLAFIAARLHCWLFFNLFPTMTPMVFLQKHYPDGQSLACTVAWVFSALRH